MFTPRQEEQHSTTDKHTILSILLERPSKALLCIITLLQTKSHTLNGCFKLINNLLNTYITISTES